MIKPIERDETLDERYSDIWSRHGGGPTPSPADFLANSPDASPDERLDVLLTDQLVRWRRGCPKSIGDYLAEYPALISDSEMILKLIQGEFLARLEREEAPDPGFYMRMFPDLAEEIRLQCEVDHWLTIPFPPSLSIATTVDLRSTPDDRGGDEGGNKQDGGSLRPSALDLPMEQEAPLRESDFQLVRLLGSGGMGEVYEAFQKSLHKSVALKLIQREALDSPSRVRRFFAEARALARLRHPHVVGVHGIGQMADGRYFLVMDLVEGGTTLAALLKGGAVPFDRAAGLVATVAEAIEHAHSRGVIHRDLKPSNVLLDAAGSPHVTDFGLAKVFDAADADYPQTSADRILGTPHFMAPEQADPGRGPISPRTDVYGLGGLLYALVTGKPPIQGDSITQLLARVVSPEPVASPRELRREVPAALERICLKCLSKEPDERYATPRDVGEALRAWLDNPESSEIESGNCLEARDRPRPHRKWLPDKSLKGDRYARSDTVWTLATKPTTAPGHSRRRRLVLAASAVSLVLAAALIVPVLRLNESMPLDGESRERPVAGSKVARTRALETAPATSPPPEFAPRPESIRATLASDTIADWDLRVYRPQADGKTWTELGNALERAFETKVGDHVKLHATSREPVFFYVFAVNPDGSAQQLFPRKDRASPSEPAAALTYPPDVDRYVTLTDPGPTAFGLLASRTPIEHASIVTDAVEATVWRTSRPKGTAAYDGRNVVPVLRTRVAESTVGPRPFADLCEKLRAHRDLAGIRAVVFNVGSE
jgi:serine/threonine protein kinase